MTWRGDWRGVPPIHSPVGGDVGLVVPNGDDAERVRAVLAEHDLPALDLPAQLSPPGYRALRQCDFVIIDIGDAATQTMAAFLQGEFVPTMRLLRNAAGPPSPFADVLFGDLSVGYRRDIVRWSTDEELHERLEERLAVIEREPQLIADNDAARRYFSAAAKRKELVFLSYSGRDADIAAQFKKELERRFEKVFDYRERGEIPAGDFWQDQIIGQLSKAPIGVILFSKSYAKSGYCLEEARHLHRHNLEGEATLLPVRLDDSPTPEWLKETQYWRLRDWSGPTELVAEWIAKFEP